MTEKLSEKERVTLADVRNALADYIASEGCSCCRDEGAHTDAAERLAKLLRVRKYGDGSGYDFNSYRTLERKR